MIIGIDVGGQFTKIGLVSGGKITAKIKTPTDKQNLIGSITAHIEKLCADNTVDISKVNGIGIGIAGMVLTDKGIVLSAANLGISSPLNIAAEIQKKFPVPVKVGNDVSLFALAEAFTRGLDNLVYVALGTGINVGVINGSKLFLGANGATIEYGHTQLKESGIKCSCGLKGCAEEYVSGRAIMAMCKKANIPASRPEDIFTIPAAKAIADGFLSDLACVLSNICNTYRPQAIFIGGGLGGALAPYINEINKMLKDKNYGYKNAPVIKVEISAVSNDGGMLGAALQLL